MIKLVMVDTTAALRTTGLKAKAKRRRATVLLLSKF